MNDQDIDLIKGGESTIRIGLRRTKNGLTVFAWARPEIEDFTRNVLGGGSNDVIPVRTIGRYWEPAGSTKDLLIYGTIANLETLTLDNGDTVNLTRVGMPIIEPQNHPATGARIDQINLGFMRLQGISEGSGVAFTVKGVYTLDAVKKLQDKLTIASRKFYITYLKPVELTVQVQTYAMSLPLTM